MSITDKSLSSLAKVMEKQDNFGINKYGVPLQSHYSYDWLAMMEEEMADFLKYFQCEKERRLKIKGLLVLALEEENLNHVAKALELLDIKGTGK